MQKINIGKCIVLYPAGKRLVAFKEAALQRERYSMSVKVLNKICTIWKGTIWFNNLNQTNVDFPTET